MMAVRCLLYFSACSYCLFGVHVLSSLAGRAGLGLQLEQDRHWTGLPVQTPDTNYKLSDRRYQLLVNIPLLPAISYHNLNISDGLFSQLQPSQVLLVEADNIRHLNFVKSEGGREGGRVGDREGGLDTLVVSRIKIYFGEMK